MINDNFDFEQIRQKIEEAQNALVVRGLRDDADIKQWRLNETFEIILDYIEEIDK